MNFNRIFLEEFVNDQVDVSNDVAVVSGRFQPVTNGHEKLFKAASDDGKRFLVVFIVKGQKTSVDKKKNPFSFEFQKEMVEKTLEYCGIEGRVLEAHSSVLGTFSDLIQEKLQKNMKWFYCGMDREETYKSQAARYKDFSGKYIEVVAIPRPEGDISATKIRHALQKNDFKFVENNIPRPLKIMISDMLRQLI